MAHESFEDENIAEYLNQNFISIKVDKEERPDIDSIYMAVCQAFTGSGGWPTTIFMTPEQKPFFAGTYFPNQNRYGRISFPDLLEQIHHAWKTNRTALMESAEEVIGILTKNTDREPSNQSDLIRTALRMLRQGFDRTYGGFGSAPKFPTPHNLLFLLSQYEKNGGEESLFMAETTLKKMYQGGIFDHIGYGFSRYSTDAYFLVPHFEKMLYDNALLILAYCKAYELTKNQLYRDIAEKTAEFILREMTGKEGQYFSAQDADSEGEEGKYYVFDQVEIYKVLGKEQGELFNQYYNITSSGNFEGKNIPNRLQEVQLSKDKECELDACRKKLYEYRKSHYHLHLDDKILCSWNSLMIAAMCHLYRISQKTEYLKAAKRAQSFLETNLCDQGVLYVSYRDGKHGSKGFLDDYAAYVFALLALYEATLCSEFLNKAVHFTKTAVSEFYDYEQGGFFLYGKNNEQLIFQPKETYDGAIPSGNSLMAYNLVRLSFLALQEDFSQIKEAQMNFMSREAQDYPAVHAMFLLALSDELEPPCEVTIVPVREENMEQIALKATLGSLVRVIPEPTADYYQKDQKTTFYFCDNHCCHPPVNEWKANITR